MSTSEVIHAITEMIQVIADNPASILIVLGFVSILIATVLPIGMGAQVVIGGLGFLMLVAGIAVHVIWLKS